MLEDIRMQCSFLVDFAMLNHEYNETNYRLNASDVHLKKFFQFLVSGVEDTYCSRFREAELHFKNARDFASIIWGSYNALEAYALMHLTYLYYYQGRLFEAEITGMLFWKIIYNNR